MACLEDLWLENNCPPPHPLQCVPGTRGCNNSDDGGGNVCNALRRLLPLTPQHCIERFGSPVQRMFFKRTSQRAFRDSWLDFAAGLHAAKPFLFLCLPLFEPPVGFRGSVCGGQMTKLLLLRFQSDNHLMTALFSNPWWLSIQCFLFSLRFLAALYALPCSQFSFRLAEVSL